MGITQTLQNYNAAAAWLQEANISNAELEKAIISTIGDLDKPLTAADKGFMAMQRFLDNTTTSFRQRWRSGVLSATQADFVSFGNRLSASTSKEKQHTRLTAVFASSAALKNANEALGATSKLRVTEL